MKFEIGEEALNKLDSFRRDLNESVIPEGFATSVLPPEAAQPQMVRRVIVEETELFKLFPTVCRQCGSNEIRNVSSVSHPINIKYTFCNNYAL